MEKFGNRPSGRLCFISSMLGKDKGSSMTIVCFIPSVLFSDFFYVNNRLWFEIYSNR